MGFGSGGYPPGLPPGLTAEDLARLLGQPALQGGGGFGVGGPVGGAPQGMPQPSPAPFGFGPMFPTMPQGGPAPVVAENEAAVRQAEASMMPPGFAPGARPQMQPAPQMTAQAPQYLPDDAAMPSVRAPLPPPRPAGFGFGPLPAPQPAAQADMPAVGASPASMPGNPGSIPPAPAGGPPAASGGGFLSRLGDPRVYNTFLGVGAGLLSAPTFSQGLAAGVGNVSKLNTSQSAQDLAQAEYGLKANKLRQELAGNNATVDLLTRKGYAPEDARSMVAASMAGNREALNAALGNVIQKAESGFRIDPATGAQTYVPGGSQDPETIRRQKMAGEYTPQQLEDRSAATARGNAAGKPDDTFSFVPESERLALGLPAGSYQRDSKGKILPVNPTGQTINMGGEKAQDATVGKGYGEYQLDLASKGRNAGSTINTLALMEQAARDPKFYSGVGAEGVKRANQLMVSLGVKDASFTRPTEVFEALSNKVVLDSLGGSLGPGISNTDRDYLGRVAPGLSRTKEGNLELIGIARSLAQRQQEVARLAREYAGGRGGRIDAGFDDVLSDYSAKNPLFPAAAAASTAQPVGATGVGSMAAPDRSAIEAELRRRGLR